MASSGTLPDNVGFIGLGLMGYPMAVNLARKLPKASRLYVFDVSAKAMENLVSDFDGQRVQICKSGKEVAESADIIITMVPEGSHVRAVYLTQDTGVLSADLSNKILIDSSTIDVETSSSVSEKIKSAFPSASFYDSPVSGGVLGAEKGTMTFMLGMADDSPSFKNIEALLLLMGGNVFACGGPTLGLTAKLCNNYCSGLIAIATSEAFAIALKKGMDPRVLANVFGKSLAQSCINDKWNPCPGVCPEAPASNWYEGGFRVELMRKDFKLACEMAGQAGVNLALGDVGLGVYNGACDDEKCTGKDSRVVYRYLGGDEDWKERFHDA